jgi:hypothetical protein
MYRLEICPVLKALLLSSLVWSLLVIGRSFALFGRGAHLAMSPNKPLQRSGVDKVLGRGRGVAVLEQVLRARVLKRGWPAAERGC